MPRGILPGAREIGRRVEASLPLARASNPRTPLFKPKDQPGVLWDAFRKGD